MDLGLETIALDRKAFGGRLVKARRRRPGEEIAKPPRAVEWLGDRAHAARREPGCHHAVLRREARMHRLRHRAELQLRAARHAEGETKRGADPFAIETEQTGAGGSGAEHADRRGRMPAS